MFTWDASDLNNPRLTALPTAFLDKVGPSIQVAATVDEADWLLLHGSEVWYRGRNDNDETDDVYDSLGDFIETGDMTDVVEPLLQQCLTRQLPCVCANPDCIVQTPTGGTAYMPGTIAQRYQEMGGTVTWFGKPQPQHFRACLETLQLPPHRVAHVGDSLVHDIAGAQSAGIPNIFVALTGIHAQDLSSPQDGSLPPKAELEQLFQQTRSEEGAVGIFPTHVVPAFQKAPES